MKVVSDPGRAPALGYTQPDDPAFGALRELMRAMLRARGLVDHPGQALFAVTLRPAAGGVDRDTETFRGSPQGPALVNDELGQVQTSGFGEYGVTVGHGRPLFREMGSVVSPTLHSEVFPYVQQTRRAYSISVVSTVRLLVNRVWTGVRVPYAPQLKTY